MSKWTNATLTADGQNLQAQLLDGGGFEFTKVTAADSSGTDKLTLTMQPSVIAGKTITVPVLLSNSNLSAGFTMNQLKFYARKTGIPAGDEIVYAIAEDETGDEIPSESDSPGFTIDWSYTFQFGNATSVNVSIDPAGLVSMALLGSPGGIATLNNAGAVPIEQGGTGAVTASAALAALGGMRASATGDDIPTSASDPTSISSQLSNRLLIHANNAAGLDCNLLIKDGRYQIQSPNILNAPPWIDPTYGHFFIDVFHHMDIWVRQTAYEVNSTRMYTRACLSGSWSQWEPIATATPPQVFDLPLAEGITALQPCTYWKNQFGAVTIGGTAEKSNGVADLTTIATLPESFRPAKNVERPATLSGGGSRYAGSVLIGSNGSVRIHTPTTANVVTFAATFLAAD